MAEGEGGEEEVLEDTMEKTQAPKTELCSEQTTMLPMPG